MTYLQKITLYAICLFTSVALYSQEEKVIKAQVINQNTNKPIAFASVYYLKKDIGTYTNEEGTFNFVLSNVNPDDTLLINHIGFQEIRKPIKYFESVSKVQMQPEAQNIEQIVVASKKSKFNVKEFTHEAIKLYNKNKRTTPHIAMAHYREKARENGTYIMFMESIGYALYQGKITTQAAYSNYKFFYENTKAAVKGPRWRHYGTNLNEAHIPISGSINLNSLRRVEHGSVLSLKHYKKYTYQLDSTFLKNDEVIHAISFKGKNDKGQLLITINDKRLISMEGSFNSLWSSAFHTRLRANLKVDFSHYDNQPFPSKISSSYEHQGLEHTIELIILQQKYNEFELNDDEYWGFVSSSTNPYIEYTKEEWTKFSSQIAEEDDLIRIAQDIKGTASLESTFIENANQWLKPNRGSLSRKKLAQKKIKELKAIF
ncbi:MAG: carboxypeptidase-like regulatory domain-containing protein [Bacteroidota bacterium]